MKVALKKRVRVSFLWEGIEGGEKDHELFGYFCFQNKELRLVGIEILSKRSEVFVS